MRKVTVLDNKKEGILAYENSLEFFEELIHGSNEEEFENILKVLLENAPTSYTESIEIHIYDEDFDTTFKFKVTK